MNSNNWMHDERIKDIPMVKKEFLQQITFDSAKLTQKEKMPFFMALVTKAKQENITFSSDEVERLTTVIKLHSSSSEVQKMDQILRMYKKGN